MKNILIILAALLFLAGCKTESSGNDNREEDDIIVPISKEDLIGIYKASNSEFTISFDGMGAVEIMNLPIHTDSIRYYLSSNDSSSFEERYGRISNVNIREDNFDFYHLTNDSKITIRIDIGSAYEDAWGYCDLATYVDGVARSTFSNVEMQFNLDLCLTYTEKNIVIKSSHLELRQLKTDSDDIDSSYYGYAEFSVQNDIILERQNDNLSGTDTEYLARYIYESNAGENLRNEYEAKSGYDLWISPKTGKVYAYPNELSIEHIYVTFKSEDEEQNQAYFYVTAKTGYFIQNSDAVALPVNIDADKLELNPETNYWRYK